MKHAKRFGLLAIVALAVMASAGVSGADAAKICSTSGTGAACASGHGNELTTQAISAFSTGVRTVKITSGFATVECDSSFAGESTHEGKGAITSLTFTNCACSLGKPVSASANASPTNPYSMTTTASGKNDGNGSMTVKGSITISFVCAGIPCKYTTAEAGGANGSLTVTGSGSGENTALATASSIILTKEEGSSGFCSSNATLEGSYAIVTPATFWIT